MKMVNTLLWNWMMAHPLMEHTILLLTVLLTMLSQHLTGLTQISFESYDTLAKGDSFGYVSQLAGYAKASGKKVGGWWVVNKANGAFKYVPANNLDLDTEIAKIQKTVETVDNNKFERCFEPVPETFRGKETGNKVLNNGCKFCAYRFDCWDNLTEQPAVMSKAKVPPVTAYIGEVIEP